MLLSCLYYYGPWLKLDFDDVSSSFLFLLYAYVSNVRTILSLFGVFYKSPQI